MAEDSRQMVKATAEKTEKMSVYTSRQRGQVEGTVVSTSSRGCRRRAGRRNTVQCESVTSQQNGSVTCNH